MTKIFAPGRERTEEGWLIYGRDKPLRQSMYPPEIMEQVMTHPAKMQGNLCKEIIEYVSEPGETILDPFGGIGTTLIGAVLGRNVALIEIEDYYAGILRQCVTHLKQTNPVLDGTTPNDRTSVLGNMMIIQADNRLAMPIPCDHIITSPPYANDTFQSTLEGGNTTEDYKQYAKNTQNIGRLNPFIYKQAMTKVYALMVKSVRIGGTITITHRDRMREGERILFIDTIVGSLVKLGCTVQNLDKWKAPGNIQGRYNKSLGLDVVEDEDIITMRRVK